MALIPEWGVLNPEIRVGVVGLVVLLVMVIVRRKMDGKTANVFNARAIGITLLGIVGFIVLDVGICMTMVWNMLIPGIVVGIVGIVLLLCLIPVVKGLE